MQFVKQMKDKFFNEKNERVQFTDKQRQAILKRFDLKCNKCKCCITGNEFDIDHIRSLSNGGTNKASNLQPLCKACNDEIRSSEHENGEYIKIIDSESSYNNNVQSVMNTHLAETHAFIENIILEVVPKNKKLFHIDVNKCRKNLLYYGLMIIVCSQYLTK